MQNDEDSRTDGVGHEEHDGSAKRTVDVGRKPAPKKATMLPRPRVYLSFPHNTEAPPNVLPGSLRVHPRGFRLLKGCSPLERRMNSYFRLPPRPAKVVIEEQRKIISEAAKFFPPPGQTNAGKHEVQLDGFILLEACGVQDPSDAKECVLNDSNLRGSATEDLPYFTSLRVLDLGENNMEMADVCQLEALEELHLHCNGIRTLRLKHPHQSERGNTDGEDDDGGMDEGSDPPVFQQLSTLNLSFNQIPYRDIASLSLLRSLERLDLSSNSLRHLPADLSGLANVSQLALENNKFSDPQVLLSLSTMPSLVEVNLNFNQFTSVPRLSMEDGAGVCFPVLQVIGLASNQMEYFEDVYALTQVATLRRVVLWGNPVERKLKDCEILIYEFGALQVQVVLESPIPPKRSIGEFYAANTQNFVRVTQRELRPIPKKGGTTRKPHTAPSHDGGGGGSDAPGGPSFFVTQVGLEQQQQRGEDSRGGGGDDGGEAHVSRQQRHQSQQPAAEESSWFAPTPHDSDPPSSAPAQRAHAGRHQGHPGGTRRVESLEDGGATEGGKSSFMGNFDADATDWGPTPGSRDDVCQPNAGVRAVMAELKRMLRQPLPPIHVPQYEQSTVSKSMRSRGK